MGSWWNGKCILLVEACNVPELLENEKGEQMSDGMPFTGHNAIDLKNTLESIYKCEMPVEVFDAFLSDYVKTKNLDEARLFAMLEWDC